MHHFVILESSTLSHSLLTEHGITSWFQGIFLSFYFFLVLLIWEHSLMLYPLPLFLALSCYDFMNCIIPSACYPFSLAKTLLHHGLLSIVLGYRFSTTSPFSSLSHGQWNFCRSIFSRVTSQLAQASFTMSCVSASLALIHKTGH